jgi:hypothetical protein
VACVVGGSIDARELEFGVTAGVLNVIAIGCLAAIGRSPTERRPAHRFHGLVVDARDVEVSGGIHDLENHR